MREYQVQTLQTNVFPDFDELVKELSGRQLFFVEFGPEFMSNYLKALNLARS